MSSEESTNKLAKLEVSHLNQDNGIDDSTAAREETTAAGGFNPANEVQGIKLVLLVFGLCFSNILTGLDFTLVATAIPVITSHFNSLNDIGWYGSAYFIAMCVALPLAGKFYMFYSKKVVYLVYIALFEIGSLVCAVAPSSHALIVGRAISGLGASGIFAGSLIIVATVAPLRKRPLLTGITNGTFGASQIIGPLIGGAFAQKVSWRWCFWINLPAGAVSFVLIVFFLKLQKTKQQMSFAANLKELDLVGFGLFAGSVTMLLLALQWGGIDYAWHSSVVIGLLVGSGITFLVFLASQWYAADSALVPPKLLKYRTTILASCACLLGPGGVATIIFFLPVWFQAVQGVNPISSGVRYLPSVISDVLTSIIGGALVMTVGWYNPFYIFGVAILAIGSGLLSTLNPATPPGKWIGYQILTGCGYSLLVTMPHIALQAVLPPELIPIASTTLLFAMTASCSIFLAAGQAIFQSTLVHNLLQIVSPDEAGRLIAAGAADFRRVLPPGSGSEVIDVYNTALTRVFYLSAASASVAFFLVSGIEWVNIKDKTQGKQNKKIKDGEDGENTSEEQNMS